MKIWNKMVSKIGFSSICWYFRLNIDIFGHIGKKKFFLRKVTFPRILLFLQIFVWYKYIKRICPKWSNKTLVSSICWYFWIFCQETTFTKWSQNNVIFLEILLFADLWTKTIFKMISKNVLYYAKVDIYGFMDKKWFFGKWCQKTCFTARNLIFKQKKNDFF